MVVEQTVGVGHPSVHAVLKEMDWELNQTYAAYPEQYEVVGKNESTKYIGHMHLRYERFYVEYVPTETIVYQSNTQGDGRFLTEKERVTELSAGLRELKKIHILQEG